MSIKEIIRPAWRLYVKKFPVLATLLKYRKVFGYFPNLKQPRALTEKLQWHKLNTYYHNDTVTDCIDKYKVRKYVADCGCSEILNTLYGVWDSPEEIEWEKLPDKFALKCNHGCGYNIICRDKSSLNIHDTEKKLAEWLNETYGLDSVELLYSDIRPKIICERYIEGFDSNDPPTDYKFFCSYGKVKLLYIINDNHNRIDYFTPDWEWIPVHNGGHPNSEGIELKKPENFELMKKYAEKLSEDFPIVRVDLYTENNNVIFGELTFLATGGVFKLNPIKYDNEFGDLFPECKKRTNK